MGFPSYKTVSGTFIYTIPDDKIIIGYVGYLSTEDPLFDPHRELQRLKTHPFIAKMLEGGKVIAYGGKTLPAGGYYSMPKLYGNGFMVCGDSASMVDVKRLKGIHLAMKSGMNAAETALAAIASQDFSETRLQRYEVLIENGMVGKQLRKTRNFHQAIEGGILSAFPELALQEVTGGRGFVEKRKSAIDIAHTQSVVDMWGAQGLESPEVQLPKPDGKLFFDKLSSVYLTGTMHDEDSPNHLLLQNGDICTNHCEPKYKAPCNHFCPASVYEMIDAGEDQPGKKKLQINYTNCIHCKTCDIKCPFGNIEWTPPEGGGGPQYVEV
jgi:electron-transferring-flavoprotein dehydrogenase